MSKDLDQLEGEKTRLFGDMAQVGDFRRGSMAITFRRCGKHNCACAKPEHPGHGPRYLLMTKVNGKSRAKDIHSEPEVQKVQRELANHHRFNVLLQQFVEVNEQICELRPVEQPLPSADPADTLKKTSAGKSKKNAPRK